MENHGKSEQEIQEMDDILGYPHDFGNLKIGWISLRVYPQELVKHGDFTR